MTIKTLDSRMTEWARITGGRSAKTVLVAAMTLGTS